LIRAIRDDAELHALPIIVETADPVALASPVWPALGVACQIDKGAFLQWLDTNIGAALLGRPAAVSARR
jgi:hypothetical protein